MSKLTLKLPTSHPGFPPHRLPASLYSMSKSQRGPRSAPEHFKQHGLLHFKAHLTHPSVQFSTTALECVPAVLAAASIPAHKQTRSAPSCQGWGSLSATVNQAQQNSRTQVTCDKPTTAGAASICWPSYNLPYTAPLGAPATVPQDQCVQLQACISHQNQQVIPLDLLPGPQSSRIPSPLPLRLISNSPSGQLQGVQCKSTPTACGHSLSLESCRKTAALVAGVLPSQHAMSQLLQEVCKQKLAATRLQGASRSDAGPSDVQQVGKDLLEYVA